MFRTLTTATLLLAATLPAFAEIAEHPMGLWVVQGTDCHAEKLTGFEITDTTLTMLDPSRARYQGSTDGKSKTTDLSAEINTLTTVEATDDGFHFTGTSQSTGRDIEITLLTDTGDGTKVKVETGTFPVTLCEKP